MHVCVCLCVEAWPGFYSRQIPPSPLSFTLSLFSRPRSRVTLLLFRRYLDCLASGERRFFPEQRLKSRSAFPSFPAAFIPRAVSPGRKLLSAKEVHVHTYVRRGYAYTRSNDEVGGEDESGYRRPILRSDLILRIPGQLARHGHWGPDGEGAFLRNRFAGM